MRHRTAGIATPFVLLTIALVCIIMPPLVGTDAAQARERRSTSQNDLTARVQAAFAQLRRGDLVGGRARLVDALQAADAAGQFKLTLDGYASAAEAFASHGDTKAADELYDAALKTRAAQQESADTALLWFNIARFLDKTNQPERAYKTALEARRRLQRAFGSNTAEDVAGNDLVSSLLVNNGAVASGLNIAEQNYNRARASLGEMEPLTWRTANNYAEALRMVGHPEVAVPIDQTLLRNRIKRYGHGSIQALVSASNLALDHLALGDEAATMEALEIQKICAAELADPRSEHVAQADAWIAYAKAYFRPGVPLDAAALERMAKIKDWNGAPDMLRVKAAQLAADQFETRGDSDRGLALRIDAYNLARTTISAAHPMTFDALLGVAMARMRRGDADTLATFEDLERQVFRWMLREVGTAGNRFVAETTRRLADGILFEFGRYALATPAAAPAYAAAVSRWKTMESGERTRLRLTLDRMPDNETRTLAQTVIRLSGQQQELLSSGKIDDDAREVLAQLQTAYQALKARTGDDTPQKIEPTSIEDRLRAADALVDFFVSGRRNRGSGDAARADMRLQAVIRRHGAAPALVDLGPLSLFVSADAAATDRAQTFRRLHDTLINPLKPHLGGAERLYLVPDAELYSLPFSLLQDASGRYLDEIYDVHLLTRADALLFSGSDASLARGQKALLAGDFDYAGAANQLPGTKDEINRVDADLQRAKLDVTMLSGAQGREKAVRAASQGTAVIHLATHGFFKAATDRTDALWRSGLLFTGSKLDGPPRRDPDDGVLYAHELMDWDLSAADLVVLSACQTALGDPSRIGSARGLPTALAIAGARRALLTLWDVNDEGVGNFMARFYQLLADEKLDYASALRKTRIEAIHGKIKEAGDPALWAAFVLFES